jgi:aminomethyltransferase
MYFPVYYNTPEEDFWSLVNDVTLWDVSVERQVEIKGPDASKFTQLLTPRNLSNCEVNQCKYVLNTNYQGGILSDPILLRLAEDHWWYSISDSDLLLWAMGVAGKDKYDIELREPDVSPLQIQGPKSRALMNDLFGSWINDLKYYWCKQTDLNGIPVVVSRTGWSGEIGYEVYLRDEKRGADLYEKIMAAGEQYKIAPTGHRRYYDFVKEQSDPRGRKIYWIGGDLPAWSKEGESDFKAVSQNYISITPIYPDFTKKAAFGKIEKWTQNIPFGN